MTATIAAASLVGIAVLRWAWTRPERRRAAQERVAWSGLYEGNEPPPR